MTQDIFDLDKNRLDEEWTQQPRLYAQYATKLADARAEHERAKASRDVVEAELDRDIRLNPEKYDLTKVTEGSIQSTITLQKAHRKVVGDVIEASHTVDTLDAYVRALDHRKKALEKLVDLRLADYFSEPRKGPVAQERERFGDGRLYKKGKARS